MSGCLEANARNIDAAASVLEVVARDLYRTGEQVIGDLEADRRRMSGYR